MTTVYNSVPGTAAPVWMWGCPFPNWEEAHVCRCWSVSPGPVGPRLGVQVISFGKTTLALGLWGYVLWNQVLASVLPFPFGRGLHRSLGSRDMVAASTGHRAVSGPEHGLSSCRRRCGLWSKSSVSWGALAPTILQHLG